MSKSITSRNKFSLLGCAAVAALATGMFGDISAALADDSASSNQTLSSGMQSAETVVVTGTRFDTDAAPAKASLDTTEPQTIINRAYIENFLPPQSDYVTILAIVPSMTGGDINGVGLSDGGTKNTLRGLPDGDFVQTYDGIPFGDTNGPTHHNISYFPASTIGSIVVDRGPGNAGTLGAATYGGSVNFYSQALTDAMNATAIGSYGSFDTSIEILNAQSGDLDTNGFGTVRALVNLQNMNSQGALTGQDLFTNNELVKIQDEFAPHWTITLFGDSSFLKENLDDNNGDTPAQIYYYGKNFALQDTNSALPTYTPYNYTSKHTDMEYVRLNGDITSGLKLENTTYTYAYWNHTFSPNCQTQTQTQIEGDTSCDNGSLKLADGSTDSNGLLAYSKENAYRVYGDILRITQDYDFGWMSGQLLAGVWWETQATHRFKYYFDAVTCEDTGTDVFDVGDVAANAACGAAYKPGSKSIEVGSTVGVNQLGYSKDDEHSDWTQYEPFAEWVIHPADDDAWTITPGLKYIHWDHGVDAPVAQGSQCGVGKNNTDTGTPPACPNAPGDNFTAGFVTRDLLPFFEVNYKLQPSWSMYFQYAKGIYVPDISAFENNPPTSQSGYPAPETTTNYQFGTVYYADQFTFDADVYYIPIHNNYITETCSYDSSETCYVNNGTATYQGLEGEGTYAFDEIIGLDLRGLSVFANGALMSSKADGSWWEPNAPMWTAAGGILYSRDGLKFSLIDKLVGSQYSNAGPGTVASFLNGNDKRYEIGEYGDLFGSVGYQYGFAELDLSIDNILDRRNTTLITVNDSSYQTDRLNSTDQYFFEAPRSVMITLKAHY